MREIRHIVLHCTATPPTATVEAIRNYWVHTLGWKRPGYHMIILPDGRVDHLQPLDLPTNGVAGHNANAIHISYIGGVDGHGKGLDNRTPQQRATQKRLVTELRHRFPSAHVLGHRDFTGVHKECPSFDVAKWMAQEGLQNG